MTTIFVLCCCQPTVFHSLDSSISITAASGGSSGTTTYNEKSCYNILRLQVFKISFNVSTDLITSSFGGSVAAGATFAFFFAAFFFFFAGFFFGDGFGCRFNGFGKLWDEIHWNRFEYMLDLKTIYLLLIIGFFFTLTPLLLKRHVKNKILVVL